MLGALFCPICQIFPVWFHCTMFRRFCCFRLTTVLENCHSDTIHNISRHKLATVFHNSMCEISFMTRFKQQSCRCFTVRWEIGLWTACNNFERYCTLPCCVEGEIILWDFSNPTPKLAGYMVVKVMVMTSQPTFSNYWAFVFYKPQVR